MTSNSICIGGDQETPFINNTFFYNYDGTVWNLFEPGLMAIPMMRAIVMGDMGGGLLTLSPSPVTAPENPLISRWETALKSSGKSTSKTLDGVALADIPTCSKNLTPDDISHLNRRIFESVQPHSPSILPVAGSRHGHSLDDVIYYKVYRNGTDIAHPVGTSHDDPVAEGITYTYWVSAFYDNNVESDTSNHVQRAANMAPGAPGNVNGVTQNSTQILISWTDPTINANGTNCIDLTNLRVYRDGILIATISPGVHQYLDTPPNPGRTYTWDVKAADEVPNEGLAGSFSGSVIDPFMEADYDWIDISGNGTPTGLNGDDQNLGPFPLGFTVNFYGVDYTAIRVSSNGLASFTSTSTAYIESVIPSTVEPNAAIYAMWDDLTLSAGQCLYYADAANNRFIISWINVPLLRSATTLNTFQIIIHQSGEVTLQYLQIPDNASCLVGVENAAGTSAIQLYFDGQGVWAPMAETAVTFWGPPPTYANVTGTVTLDGGVGNVTQALVSANGVSHPSTNPAVNGTYTLSDVQTGTRRIIATLANYDPDTLIITLNAGGYTNANLVLRRNVPPAPTGLTATVDNGTGITTLNWTVSPDLLIDNYRIYRKLHSDQTWTPRALVGPRTTTTGRDTLTVPGIYDYAITAIDNNVIPPAIESARSNVVQVLYGALPPNFLTANGNFDNKIRLSWLAPGISQSYQIFYDDSTSEVWFRVNNPNGPQDYFAVRFTPPSPDSTSYPLPVQTCNIYMERSDPLPNVWLCEDNAGAPDLATPLGHWTDIGANGTPGWLIAHSDGAAVLADESDFWVVWQFPPGLTGPGTGSDNSAPDSRSYWTQDGGSLWNLWTSYDWMARVWVGGAPPPGQELNDGDRAGGFSAMILPSGVTAPPLEMTKTKSAKVIGPVAKTKIAPVVATSIADPWQAVTRPEPRITQFAHQRQIGSTDSRHRGSLDDVTNYKIYRNGTLLVQVPATQTTYDNTGLVENVQYSYYVTALYDDGAESGASNTVQRACNMAPVAPANFTGVPQGNNAMHLTWTDPTLNGDGSPCVDLASVRIYRDADLIFTVPAGTMSYTDIPPQNNQRYTWSARAIDEVPNEGQAATFSGAVVSPWMVIDYEWVDIAGNGTPSGLTNDDQNVGPFALGFDFEFYGQTYNQVYICSNGWVSFTSTSTVYSETAIPNSAEPNNVLYLFWDDMYLPSGGQVLYYADPTGQFIVSWLDVPHISGQDGYTYQVIIGSDGSVTYNYHTIPTTFPGNTSCTIGVENATGTDAVQLLYDGTGDFMPANSTAVQFWGGPSGELAGIVRVHSTSQPLPGVAVFAVGVGDTAYSDASGNYLYGLEPGTYSVTYAKAGYCDTTLVNVVIEDGNTTVRNVRMLAPSVTFDVTSISEATWPGHDVATTFHIGNPTGNCPLEFVITDTSAWLVTSPSSGEVNPGATQTITVIFQVGGLPPGAERHSELRVAHGAIGSPRIIPVDLVISVSAEDPNAPMPTEYAFLPNYPNPFNATTALRFDVPQQSRVKITIFNIMGQEVARPVDDVFAAGRHSINYTATDLPSGMYVMRMEAGSFSALNKMVLLK
jgi:hypothetical protein